MNKQEKTVLILGAGFSYVAGLPLAKDLFNAEVLLTSNRATRHYEAVLASWKRWSQENPNKGPEEFLSEIYMIKSMAAPTNWEWAVESVAIILATPLKHDFLIVRNPRYSGRITKPVLVSVHELFWDTVLKEFNICSVITTNYDILIERGLRHKQVKRRNRPGFYYGGFERPQKLKGTALPFSVRNQNKIIELNIGIPLYKLHGSLNWGTENGAFIMYQDLRPAFRHGGNAQIIPPITEKETPDWLFNVWEEAGTSLKESNNWIICGYSLPDYDIALFNFFKNMAQKVNKINLIIIDPHSHVLKEKWKAIAPHAMIYCLQGLPQGIEELVNI